jgi:predicted metal-dependent hydrolase
MRNGEVISLGDEQVELRRSTRRRRTVSAYRDGDRIVILLPDGLSRRTEARWIAEMVGKVGAREARERTARPSGDAALLARCDALAGRYLDGCGVVSVRWVGAMRTRWASCTPDDGAIRVSTRLRHVPPWVLDYVLVHELAHLRVPTHDAAFWALVQRYPRTERARGYLDGLSAAGRLGYPDDLAEDLDGGEHQSRSEASRNARDYEGEAS